jgi:multidrug efflux pump subunit AcrA (membrane-fusion protein)
MLRIEPVALIVVIMTLLIGGCAEEPEEPGTEAVVEYETAIVKTADVTAELDTDGRVVAPPNEYAAIECSYCAPVSRVFATVGQSLEKGAVIVELSHPDVRAAIDAAQVELEQARENLQEVRQEYASDVASAEARLEAAQVSEREAREALQDAQQQTPPPEDIEQLAVDYERAHQRRLRMEDRLEAAEERMEEALEPHRRRVRAAEQALADARAEQTKAMISTPIDGQLIELNVDPGEQPGRIGGPMAVVADLSTLRVHARLTQQQARGVEPGMPVTITLPAVDDMRFEGEVDRVNTQMEGPATEGGGQRNYIAIIPFENTRGEAKPEMKANLIVHQGTARDVPVVPAEAVNTDDDGRAFVNVQVRDDSWERRDVVTGLRGYEMVEIEMGLEAGEIVRLEPDVTPTPEV